MTKSDPEYVQAVIDQSAYDLTFAQQAFVKKTIADMKKGYTLVDLMKETYKEPSLNERSLEYDQIRKYVAKIKRNVNPILFTESQVEFMENNAHVMKALEIAKTIFPDKEIVPLSSETQTVAQYLKAVGLEDTVSKDDDYRPPKTTSAIVRKINAVDTLAEWNPNDLSPFQRKCVESIKSYFQSIRFISYMNLYNSPEDRVIIEEEFLKAIYDKPDLNTEELNMYITLCSEYVSLFQKERSKKTLESNINTTITATDDDSKKLYMTYVDLLGKFEQEINQTKRRIETLQKNLSDTRSNRLKSMATMNDSLTKFVEQWKSEEGRKHALKVAEARNLMAAKEIDRLESMPEYIANVMGIGRDEMLKN